MPSMTLETVAPAPPLPTNGNNNTSNNKNNLPFNNNAHNAANLIRSVGGGSAINKTPLAALTEPPTPSHANTIDSLLTNNAGPPPVSALHVAAQRAAAAAAASGYGCHFQAGAFLPLEQYRLQLYNYALNIERLRCPQYSAAAAMAAASYVSNAAGGTGASNGHSGATGGGTTAAYGMPPGSRLALSMSLFPQRIFQPEEPKPQHSYIGLIAMAILSSAETKLVLSDIYQYILDNYPYFRTRGPGWRNSIRHNLSLNDCFIKSGRSANGKGHYWAIHPANMEDFRKGDFRRRKAQRKVRKHMGLSVDDASTDSPSPPPLDLSSPPPSGGHLPFGYLPHHPQHAHQLEPHQPPQLQSIMGGPFGPHTQHTHYIGQAFGNAAAAAAALAASGMPHYPYAYHQAASQAHNHGVLPPNAGIYAHYNNNNNNKSHNNNNNHSSESLSQAPPSLPHAPVTDTDAAASQLAIIKETTTTTRTATATATASVIANLYSQTRKRQFDVASLLAPEVKVDIVNDNCALTTIERCSPSGSIATATQHTVITKVSVQQQHHHRHHHHTMPYQPQPPHPPHPASRYYQQPPTTAPPLPLVTAHKLLELEEQEDIDVVASDADEFHQRQTCSVELAESYADIEADNDSDRDHDDEVTPFAPSTEGRRHSCVSISRRSSADDGTDAATSSHRQSPLSDTGGLNELQPLLPPANIAAYELLSNSLSSQPDSPDSPTQLSAQQHEQQHVQRLMQRLQQQQHPHSVGGGGGGKLHELDSRFFGRYYGTYMAAAAAHRINLTQMQGGNGAGSGEAAQQDTEQQQQQQQHEREKEPH